MVKTRRRSNKRKNFGISNCQTSLRERAQQAAKMLKEARETSNKKTNGCRAVKMMKYLEEKARLLLGLNNNKVICGEIQKLISYFMTADDMDSDGFIEAVMEIAAK